MKTIPLSLLRRIHRALVYTPLDHVVGKRAQVGGPESAHDDILAALAEHLPLAATTKEPEPHYIVGAIAKYGILDLTYGIASTTLPIFRPGISVLRRVRLDADGVESDPDALAMGEDFLKDMALECEGPLLQLKLFLKAEKPSPTEHSLKAFREAPPSTFSPATFIVDDACLTNAGSIWLLKHFYL